jgi:hypothetical protein
MQLLMFILGLGLATLGRFRLGAVFLCHDTISVSTFKPCSNATAVLRLLPPAPPTSADSTPILCCACVLPVRDSVWTAPTPVGVLAEAHGLLTSRNSICRRVSVREQQHQPTGAWISWQTMGTSQCNVRGPSSIHSPLAAAVVRPACLLLIAAWLVHLCRGSDDEVDEGRIESTADTELYKLTLPTEVSAAPQVSALTLQAAAHMHTQAAHQATAPAKQGVQHKKQCAYCQACVGC